MSAWTWKLALAAAAGFGPPAITGMPANNLLVGFRQHEERRAP